MTKVTKYEILMIDSGSWDFDSGALDLVLMLLIMPKSINEINTVHDSIT